MGHQRRLILTERIFYESHCHTPLCKHATGTPVEYAEQAASRGLKGIVFTCHCPLPDGHSAQWRMGVDQFGEYVDLIADARSRMDGRVDVRLGLESDFFPGIEPWIEKLHRQAPLHHVLGSVHMQMSAYRQRYFNGDYFEYQKTYFNHLAEAAETGLYDTLAHPDLVKNESPASWHFSRIQPFIERALDRIASTGVAMELNTSGLNKALPEMNPGPGMLKLMRARGIPVVIGADAHSTDRVGDHFQDALRLLENAGYSEVSIFLGRQRQALPIAAVKASLVSE
ncbi:MAG: histidinol-phosphatase [Opitutaceae bacterium]|nr:histidinol-phosphatase [Opitutaceae bacterium]